MVSDEKHLPQQHDASQPADAEMKWKRVYCIVFPKTQLMEFEESRFRKNIRVDERR